MLDITQIIKTVNTIISKSSEKILSGLVTGTQTKPLYNNNTKGTPKVCKLNLECCKTFYKDNSNDKFFEKNCPFGFTVSKKTFDISSKQNNVSIFSIIDYKVNKTAYPELNNLPREIKKQKEEVLFELENITLERNSSKDQHEYLENLIETLLVGRIGMSIQGLSHQFFTPLQGALSDLQNLKSGNDTIESLTRLEKNFESLNKLATEVQLILASNEEFNQNMLRRVTVHAMISEIIGSLEATSKQKHIKVSQGFNHFTKTVHAIPGQLQIVLSNIIHNSIKYSFTGFPTSPIEVTITYEDGGQFLIIKIQNEGCKITNEEIRDRLLFDLGYRGIHSRDRQRKGTGTGLYVSDFITKTHNGKIEVESRHIGGSIKDGTERHLNTFSIYWPYYFESE